MLTVPCDWSESSAYRVYDSNAVIVGEVIAARQALPEDRYDAVVQVGGKSLLTGCRDNIRLLISHLSEALRTTKGINCSFFCKLDVAFIVGLLALHCNACAHMLLAQNTQSHQGAYPEYRPAGNASKLNVTCVRTPQSICAIGQLCWRLLSRDTHSDRAAVVSCSLCQE